MNPSEAEMPQCKMLYLAAPLFSEAEREFNLRLAHRLEDFVKVYLPQRDGGLMSTMIANGVPAEVAAIRVFRRDTAAIYQSDCLLAVLDGRAIDEGVAFELGVAFSHSKRCVGLQTDSRRLGVWGNNPMISGSLESVVLSVDDVVAWVRCELADSVRTRTHVKKGTKL